MYNRLIINKRTGRDRLRAGCLHRKTLVSSMKKDCRD